MAGVALLALGWLWWRAWFPVDAVGAAMRSKEKAAFKAAHNTLRAISFRYDCVNRLRSVDPDELRSLLALLRLPVTLPQFRVSDCRFTCMQSRLLTSDM